MKQKSAQHFSRKLTCAIDCTLDDTCRMRSLHASSLKPFASYAPTLRLHSKCVLVQHLVHVMALQLPLCNHLHLACRNFLRSPHRLAMPHSLLRQRLELEVLPNRMHRLHATLVMRLQHIRHPVNETIALLYVTLFAARPYVAGSPVLLLAHCRAVERLVTSLAFAEVHIACCDAAARTLRTLRNAIACAVDRLSSFHG